MAARSSFLPLVRKFFEHDPMIAAHVLETMDVPEAIDVLKSLPPTLSSQAFNHLQVGYAASLLEQVPPELFREIVEKLDPQQGVNILANCSSHVLKERLDGLSEKIRLKMQELLTYPENSAGRIMSWEYLAFRTELKVKDAIQKIRLFARRSAPLSYVYVVDGGNHLVGVINMRDLVVAGAEAHLESVMTRDIFSVHALTDREEAAHQLSKRNYFAVPVVDSENKLLGVLKTDNLISHVQEEATEDIQKMFGAGGDERAFSPVGFALKKRLPWLYVNLATAFLASAVIAIFEETIARITVLAVFLPVVAGQGGNAGAQSLAVVMRGLVMREIPPEHVKKLILREGLIGIASGVAIGAVTAGVAWLWHGNPYLGVVIGLAMIVNLVAAGLSGAAIPVTLKSLGFDPAQSSNIILTTVTDVVGFLSFLSFAALFERYLI